MLTNRFISTPIKTSRFFAVPHVPSLHRKVGFIRRTLVHRNPNLHIAQTSLNRAIPPNLFAVHSSAKSRVYSSEAIATTVKPAFSILEWRRATMERLKAKKAQLLVEYGSTFIFLHETLGIASYLTCFGIASLGLISIDEIINFIGIVPDHIKDMISLKEGTITTTALTALVLLKCLDFLGLTPLRWALAITLTPRIAWWVGPRVDASVAWVKSKFTKVSSTTTPAEPSS